jgi:hypothetical protein
MYLRYTWTKTLRHSSLNASFDMGFGQASMVPDMNRPLNLKLFIEKEKSLNMLQ